MADFSGTFRPKRGTSAEWASSSIALRDGELGIDTAVRRMKIGDGVSLWATLPWISPDQATLEQLQALAAAVEGATSPNDAATAALVTQNGSATKQALETTIAAAIQPALVEKTTRPGVFDITDPTRITEDPTREGVFLIGVVA